MSFIQLTLCAVFVAAALSLIMASAWYVQQKSGKTGWVDVTWSLGVGGIAFIAAAWPLGQAWSHWRQIIVAVLAAILVPAAGLSHCRAQSCRGR